MKAKRFCLCLFWMVFLMSQTPVAARAETLPCFPGAEGFGTQTPGGRGGRVIKVINLNPGGPGSLQAACSAEGPRIVVFDVSGVIPGDVLIEHGQITIQGQTAPGAGITIKGLLHSKPGPEKLEDLVVRFLRIRPDQNRAPNDVGDAIRFSMARRVVIDHCSSSWASDETIDIFRADDVTVQWCTIEDGDTLMHPKGIHNFGLIQGPDGRRCSVHHNLFAHQRRRCPAIANGPADVRNNVVYNFRDGFLHDNPTNRIPFNIIGNYYKRGPNDPHIFPFCFTDSTCYYLRDNYIEGAGLVQDPWAEKDKLEGLRYYARFGIKAEHAAEVPPVTTQAPQEAYRLVLESAGCFPRDTLTRRAVQEVRDGTGSWGRREVGDLLAGLAPQKPPKDTDNDGMPDEWETENGLDPKDGTDHIKVMQSGYTAVEEYCNMLARRLSEGQGR
ncbi:MAG TPA: pectate lyase precursor [archaeon]|nr:pectate lyase precursor [archaeon]